MIKLFEEYNNWEGIREISMEEILDFDSSHRRDDFSDWEFNQIKDLFKNYVVGYTQRLNTLTIVSDLKKRKVDPTRIYIKSKKDNIGGILGGIVKYEDEWYHVYYVSEGESLEGSEYVFYLCDQFDQVVKCLKDFKGL